MSENNLRKTILGVSSIILGCIIFKGVKKLCEIINKQENKKSDSYSKTNNLRNGVLDMMKNTPLVYIKSLSELTGVNIYGKCEYLLPYTSKDRMIKNIILDAQEKKLIDKDSVIYEGSSGSTAYSVAAISRLLGYKCVIVVPDDVSEEKMRLLKTTGCEIKITKQKVLPLKYKLI